MIKDGNDRNKKTSDWKPVHQKHQAASGATPVWYCDSGVQLELMMELLVEQSAEDLWDH